jgi:hypothetical protein
MYKGKESTYITNIFKNTNIKIAFCTNTIYNHLTQKHHITNKYAQSRVYKLTCLDCKKAHVGQTGRSFLLRYNEHKQAFKKNCHSSKFAQHLLEQAHPLSNINNTMQILHYQKKSAHLNTLERYHIHTEFTTNNHLNDSQNIFPNKIFDAILKTKQQ